jgi:phosphatidylinositol alpha-mannosyltransferase
MKKPAKNIRQINIVNILRTVSNPSIKMTIGFVLDDSLDKNDGVQQYVLALGNWMTSQGHDVHYLMGHTKRTDIPNVYSLSRNMKVRFNGNRMSMPLPGRKKSIRRVLQDIPFDILHIQMPYSPFLAARIIKYASPHTAIIGTFHIAPYSSAVSVANKSLSVVLKRSLKRFNDIVSVSQAAADFAKATYGIESEILPNVVDVKRFSSAKPLFAESKPVILFLGRLVPRKGCRTLLEAAAILSKERGIPSFKVHIGGGGHLGDELKQYVNDHGLGKIVTFQGFINEDLKPGFYASGDIAVFPSSGGESFGIVLLEAMASGRPVVLGGDNPGYRTVLGPKPELLFPARDSVQLAEKLSVLLLDSHKANSIVAWQKEYVPSFDVAVVGEKLIKRYVNAVNSLNDHKNVENVR